MIELESDNAEECVLESNDCSRKKKKKVLKKGIVYLSTIPPFMNVTKISEIMRQYGEVGRVFLQPAKSKKPGGLLYSVNFASLPCLLLVR